MGLVQPGRISTLEVRGRRFKSCIPYSEEDMPRNDYDEPDKTPGVGRTTRIMVIIGILCSIVCAILIIASYLD